MTDKRTIPSNHVIEALTQYLRSLSLIHDDERVVGLEQNILSYSVYIEKETK